MQKQTLDVPSLETENELVSATINRFSPTQIPQLLFPLTIQVENTPVMTTPTLIGLGALLTMEDQQNKTIYPFPSFTHNPTLRQTENNYSKIDRINLATHCSHTVRNPKHTFNAR